MGTILNGQAEVFQTIAAGVAKHKDIQLVLSIGDQLEPEQIGPVPRTAIIVKRAPQLELLKLASVCITHSGLNTVLESLAQGVPQVAIPVTFDQPGIAARIAYHKTGMVASLDKLSAAHLSSLLGEVLSDPTYRENACRIQKAIVKANGLSAAADLIDIPRARLPQIAPCPGRVGRPQPWAKTRLVHRPARSHGKSGALRALGACVRAPSATAPGLQAFGWPEMRRAAGPDKPLPRGSDCADDHSSSRRDRAIQGQR